MCFASTALCSLERIDRLHEIALAKFGDSCWHSERKSLRITIVCIREPERAFWRSCRCLFLWPLLGSSHERISGKACFCCECLRRLGHQFRKFLHFAHVLST